MKFDGFGIQVVAVRKDLVVVVVIPGQHRLNFDCFGIQLVLRKDLVSQHRARVLMALINLSLFVAVILVLIAVEFNVAKESWIPDILSRDRER